MILRKIQLLCLDTQIFQVDPRLENIFHKYSAYLLILSDYRWPLMVVETTIVTEVIAIILAVPILSIQ